MSRIDRALRIKEGRAGSVPADDHDRHSDDASSLQQYEREERLAILKERAAPEGRALEAGPGADAPSRRVTEPVRRSRPDTVSRPAPAPRHKFATDGDRKARLVTGTSSAVSIEQYRKLAAVLHEEQVRSQLKTVIVTSALPGEGKTLTVVNLALTLSESYGKRVLVIDADLRGPSSHSALDISNERGLSDALKNDHPLSFVAVSDHLSVLPAGTAGGTPLAGLTSDRMAQILEECASRFDWVLIDTPPVGVLSDAQVLVRLAGAVLFVVGAGVTPAATVERAIGELGGPDAIFGVVLNRVEDRLIPSASYYGHYRTSGK